MLRNRRLRIATIVLITMLLAALTVGVTSAAAHSCMVEAITDDPVRCPLCITTLGLFWWESPPSYLLMDAWAACPSEMGTHWYVRNYSKSGPYYYQWYTKGSGHASYYNYDFMLDHLRTDVSHSIWIRGTWGDATGHYSVDWTRSGEYWWLLDLDVVVK